MLEMWKPRNNIAFGVELSYTKNYIYTFYLKSYFTQIDTFTFKRTLLS